VGTVEAERAGGRGDARVGIAADADGHRGSGHLGRLRPRRWYYLVTLVSLEEQSEQWRQQIPRSRPLS